MKQVITTFIREAAPDVPAAVAEQLSEALASATLANPQVELLDKLSALYPGVAQISDYLFDLLTVSILENEPEGLESREWSRFEDAWVDRGSELLNLLVYLRECAEYEVVPSLDDFLNEFLLVEEEDFQEELRIYEPVVRQAGMIKDQPQRILDACRKAPAAELGTLYFPLFLFFSTVTPEQKASFLKNQGSDLQVESALYHLMLSYSPHSEHGAN